MAFKDRDLLHGNIWREMILFSLPLMASNMLQVLFNMADIAVIGQFAGALSLGAVGSTSIFITLFTGLLIGAGSGINVLVARRLGEGREEAIRSNVHTAFLFSLIYGAVLLAAGLLSSAPVLTLLGTKEELYDKALLYLRLYFLGIPAMALYNFGSAVFSAAGDTRRPLLFLTSAGIVNIALNLLFVIVFRMDVAGVALASVISQWLSALLIITALFRSCTVWGLRRQSMAMQPDVMKQLMMLAIPSGFQTAVFAVANMFVQAGVNSFSTIVVSGNTSATNADAIVYDVMAAVYTGCSSFMGQNYGAGNKKRVRDSYLIATLYSFLIGGALGLGIMFNGPFFLGLFCSDPAVIQAGMLRLGVMGWSYAFSAFMDNTIAASRALGRVMVPTVIVVLGSVVFRIIWIFTIFAHFHTIHSLYLLYIFSWSLTGFFEILYFVRCYKELVAHLPDISS